MENELRNFIRASSGISNTQWEMAVEDESNRNPLITIVLVSDTFEYMLSGQQPLRNALVQVDVWTDDFLEGVSLREVIIAATEAYAGPKVKAISVTQVRSGKDVDDNTVFRQSIDLRVRYVR